MSAFTPEQEIRIAEIVEDMLTGQMRQRHGRELGDIRLEMSWARYWAGIADPKGRDDD